MESVLWDGQGKGGSWSNIRPVSYTHLDVYKRQGCDQPVLRPTLAACTVWRVSGFQGDILAADRSYPTAAKRWLQIYNKLVLDRSDV